MGKTYPLQERGQYNYKNSVKAPRAIDRTYRTVIVMKSLGTMVPVLTAASVILAVGYWGGTVDTGISNLGLQVETIKGDVAVLQEDTRTIKSDVAMLQEDTRTIKSDVAMLQEDTRTIKSDVATLQSDINDLKDINREILEHLSQPRTADASSPLQLNGFGREVSSQIDARGWAENVASQLVEQARGKEEFEIFHLCSEFVKQSLKDDPGFSRTVQAASYNHGTEEEHVLMVYRIELRDIILSKLEN